MDPSLGAERQYPAVTSVHTLGTSGGDEMTVSQTLEREVHAGPAPSAVIWINGRKAIVARTEGEEVVVHELDRGVEPEVAYLARVVHEIGDRERVVIMGPGSTRLALEREYVTVFHRPERLVDVEPSGELEADEIIERLRDLAS
jgi:hypothetical protein